jgi:hypothetical protein
MLTDLTSLTLEQQEVSMVVESDADSFAGLFSQQLPQASGIEEQGVDFKDFLEKLPIQTETSEITPELPRVATDGEFPLHHPGAFSRNPNRDINTPPEPVNELVKQILRSDSNGMLNAPTSGEKGELLPIGGNLLPDDAGLEIAKQGVIEKAYAPSMTVVAGAEAIRPASSEVLTDRLSNVTQAPTVAPQTGGAASLQGPTIGVTEKGVVASDFVAVMGKSSAPESDQVIARDKIVTPESLQTLNKELQPEARPGVETRQPGVAGMMRNPDVGTAPPPSTPVDMAGLTPQSAIAAVTPVGVERSVLAERIQKGLNQNVTRDLAATPVAITDRVLPLADKIPVADTLSARDMLNTSEYRNLEIPVQPAANTSQQNVAVSTGAVQAFSAFSLPLAAHAQTNAFPTHLETMTLARNADSTELGSGLSERVNWMINQKQNTATIRLDPPFLGKLDVQIKIADDATTVVFQTQHAQTRDLIESASVRLRDFLQDSGYQNVNVDVSQRQDQQQARSQASFASDADQQDESHQDPDFDHQERDAVNYFIGDGIVDTFA